MLCRLRSFLIGQTLTGRYGEHLLSICLVANMNHKWAQTADQKFCLKDNFIETERQPQQCVQNGGVLCYIQRSLPYYTNDNIIRRLYRRARADGEVGSSMFSSARFSRLLLGRCGRSFRCSGRGGDRLCGCGSCGLRSSRCGSGRGLRCSGFLGRWRCRVGGWRCGGGGRLWGGRRLGRRGVARR